MSTSFITPHMRSKKEIAELHEKDLDALQAVYERALGNLDAAEWNLNHPNPSEGLIDLYSERTRKTPDTAGETDIKDVKDSDGFASLNLYAARMKSKASRKNGSL